MKNTVAYPLATASEGGTRVLDVEHALGATPALLELNNNNEVTSAGMLRTTRKLFEGQVFA